MKRTIHIKATDPEVARKLAKDFAEYFEAKDIEDAERRKSLAAKKKPGFFKRLFSKKDK